MSSVNPADPAITRVCDAIVERIKLDCNNGRITPPVLDFPPSIKVETHDAYPAVVTRVKTEAAEAGAQQLIATIEVTVVLDDPNDDMEQREIRRYAWQIADSLTRVQKLGPARFEINGIAYDDRKKGEGSLVWAVLRCTAMYHGGRG